MFRNLPEQSGKMVESTLRGMTSCVRSGRWAAGQPAVALSPGRHVLSAQEGITILFSLAKLLHQPCGAATWKTLLGTSLGLLGL